ncbi:MAG TPA: hypothetical protein VL400_07800, partial [Polyangiaceae bacterium]|nr:hypothetical protein [Polyangiaceae bacterium]
AATDPANAFGAALPWPESESRLGRAPGAHVVLDHGELIGYLPRGGESLISLVSRDEDPEARALRARAGQALARALAADVAGRRAFRHLSKIDGGDASKSALAAAFVEAGFEKSGSSLLLRREGSFGGGRRRR